jgi:predicted P-loop ATPase/GTPase
MENRIDSQTLKKKVCEEISGLMLEVIKRLERENPQLLQSLFLSSEEERVSSVKSRRNKIPN